MSGKTPDVRVRLSAEGVKEVVAAMQKIQQEAGRTSGAGKRASQGFAGLEQAAMRLASAAALGALVKSLFDAAQSAERLTAQFRASVGAENYVRELTWVRQVSTELGLEFESTAEAYGKFMAATRNTSLEGESTRYVFQSVAQAATALKLSTEDVNGVFLALSQMLSKGKVSAEELRGQLGERLPGAYRLAAEAMGISTAELDKQMKAGQVMATDLLPKLAKKLEETYGKEAQESAKGLTGSFNRMKNSVTELAQAVGTALAPAFSVVMGAASWALNKVKEFTAGIEIMALRAGNLVQRVKLGYKADHGDKQAAEELKRLNEAEQFYITNNILARYWPAEHSTAPDKSAAERMAEQKRNAQRAAKEIADATKDAHEKASTARLELEEAKAEQELAIQKALHKLSEDENKRAYEAGLISAQDYYEKKKALAIEATDAEIAALERKLASEKQKPADDEAARLNARKEIAKLEGQIAEKQVQLQNNLREIEAERQTKERQHKLDMLALERQLAEAEGDRHKAALLALEERIGKLDAEMRRRGLSDEERQQHLGKVRETGEASIAYDETAREAQDAMNRLERERREIEREVQRGAMSAVEGNMRIQQLERERLETLREIGRQLEANAEASGDENLIQQAEEYNERVKDIEASTNRVINLQAQLTDALVHGGFESLKNAITDVITGAEGIGDAFKNMGKAVLGMIAEIIAQMIAWYVITTLLGAVFPGFKNTKTPQAPSGGNLPMPEMPWPYRGGGVAFGKGGYTGDGTRDAVAGVVHRGEYVINADATRQWRPLLEAINDASGFGVRGPRYATGGYVDGAVKGGGAAVEVNVINNTGQPVTQQERTGPDGTREIEVVIGQMVAKNIRSGGSVAQAMQQSFGVNRQGVHRG
jgi:tape measure domain-containing protein